MSEINFSGPITVDPALAMALWNSMPEIGKSGCAQLFFSRFVTAPISEEAVLAGARVFFEKNKIPEEAAKLLKAAVGKRCKELAESMTDTKSVHAIADAEMRTATAKYIGDNIGKILAEMDPAVLVETAGPVIREVIKNAAHHYITRTQPGQQWLLELVQRIQADGLACENAVLEEIGASAAVRPELRNGSA